MWRLRLLALALAPLLLLAVEVLLRLVGYGYPTRFFLPAKVRGQDALVNNPRYGWRFGPPPLAREPVAFTLPRAKAPGTLRIFVLGESAAMGDPDARFGLSRMLEALLSQRYPGQRFEVVCGAFAAISSHVMAEVADECARQAGDAWVIYAGNNEVVGPFGAGSIFGPQVPPRPLIRASLALKSTRLGQALSALFDWVRRDAAGPTEWKGMETLLREQVSSGDPRMQRVYGHFQENLRATLTAARRAGVKVVLSTMATNLRDCPPFASGHGRGLTPEQRTEWERAFAEGLSREQAEDWAGAVRAYLEAAAIDDGHAELNFRLARCYRHLRLPREAAERYRAARDADRLRFRADSRINDIIRAMAREHAGSHLRFLDAEALFARQGPDGVAGGEYFYEHVHLTPVGNHLLAQAMAKELVALLEVGGSVAAPDSPANPSNAGPAAGWASASECLRWLGCTGRNLHDLWSLMLDRCSRPPFTLQLEHTNHLRWLEIRRDAYRPATKPAQLRQSVRDLGELVASRPEDPHLRSNLAAHLELAGENARSEEEWRAAIERLPNSWQLWFNLGNLLAEEGRKDEAQRCYARSLALNPWRPEVSARLAALSPRQGR